MDVINELIIALLDCLVNILLDIYDIDYLLKAVQNVLLSAHTRVVKISENCGTIYKMYRYRFHIFI